MPGRAVVVRSKDAAPRSAAVEPPRRARKLPHAGKKRRGAIGNAHQRRDAAGWTNVERTRPMCAAVARHVNAAIGILGGNSAKHPDGEDAPIARVDRDTRNVRGTLEAGAQPMLSA